MLKPKKLIREKIVQKLNAWEWEIITDQDELNKLYALKIQEELAEIQNSDHKDPAEFSDLVFASMAFAYANGFEFDDIDNLMMEKILDKGAYTNIALTNLNPDNPSNAIYFKEP